MIESEQKFAFDAAFSFSEHAYVNFDRIESFCLARPGFLPKLSYVLVTFSPRHPPTGDRAVILPAGMIQSRNT